MRVLKFAICLAVTFVSASDINELTDEDEKLIKLENQLRELVQKDHVHALRELAKRQAEIALEKLAGTYDKRSVNDGAECKDKERESKEGLCKIWQGLGACEGHKDVMRRYCAKTCDLCKAPAPPVPEVPDCAYTKYGCCWDNKTSALGENGHGCLPCLDRSANLCKVFLSDCGSKLRKGLWMRDNCPVSCKAPCDYNLNVNKCKDDGSVAQFCGEWMQEGRCEKEKEKMEVLCRSTCGLCKSHAVHMNFLG